MRHDGTFHCADRPVPGHALISFFEHDLLGKPVPTFPDHALCLSMIFSENRFPLFRIML